jgi:hypothetical protein
MFVCAVVMSVLFGLSDLFTLSVVSVVIVMSVLCVQFVLPVVRKFHAAISAPINLPFHLQHNARLKSELSSPFDQLNRRVAAHVLCLAHVEVRVGGVRDHDLHTFHHWKEVDQPRSGRRAGRVAQIVTPWVQELELLSYDPAPPYSRSYHINPPHLHGNCLVHIQFFHLVQLILSCFLQSGRQTIARKIHLLIVGVLVDLINRGPADITLGSVDSLRLVKLAVGTPLEIALARSNCLCPQVLHVIDCSGALPPLQQDG